jgi:hypothetical protein
MERIKMVKRTELGKKYKVHICLKRYATLNVTANSESHARDVAMDEFRSSEDDEGIYYSDEEIDHIEND